MITGEMFPVDVIDLQNEKEEGNKDTHTQRWCPFFSLVDLFVVEARTQFLVK